MLCETSNKLLPFCKNDSIRWIESFLQKGNSLLLVSHSMFLVQKLCHRALWLHDGRTHMQGDVFEVTQSYLAWHESKADTERQQREQLAGDGGLYRIGDFAVVDADVHEERVLQQGDSLEVSMTLVSPDGRVPVALFGIVRADGTAVYGVASDFDGIVGKQVDAHRYQYRIRFPDLLLLPGSYSIRGHCMDPEGLRVCDTVEKRFRVRGQSRELGFIRLPHEWCDQGVPAQEVARLAKDDSGE
jgi:lipopolysaccharide transport system ATP-binding protein